MAGPIVESPIRGEWKAIHNPGDTPFALDFVGLRSGARLPYPRRSLLPHCFYRVPATTAYGWNRPVYAPFDGEVIEARDGYPDTLGMNLPRDLARNVLLPPNLDEGIQRFAGNYVVVSGADGVAFLAHLRCDSIAVTEGDDVAVGSVIGAIGNAGASLVPHLHFQLLSEWPSTIVNLEGMDRSFRFRKYDRWGPGEWEPVRNRRPESGDRIRIRE